MRERGRSHGPLVLLLLACACGNSPARSAQLASPEARRGSEQRATAVAASASPAQTTPAPEPAPEATPPLDAAPPPDATQALLALSAVHSASLGAPGNGTLEGGVLLPDAGPGFLHNPKRPPEARYGTVELVQAIARAAAVVERELPGMALVVNDLSLAQGGPIAQHGSHQNGRDADILYYVLDKQREPLQSVGVPLDPDGKGFDFKELPVAYDDVPVQLDAPRTWRFVQALLEASGQDVQRIFMVEHVRTLLLAQAERARAPKAVRERFEAVTCQPGTPHDDHMHVRLFCAADDIARGCLDKPPIYPWQREALRLLGLAPVLERVGDRRARDEMVAERTTTSAEARKRAGPMHAKVRAFLARRAAWETKPSPGRLYCK